MVQSEQVRICTVEHDLSQLACIVCSSRVRQEMAVPVADGAMCPYLPSETYTALAAGTQEVSKGRQASNASNTVQVSSCMGATSNTHGLLLLLCSGAYWAQALTCWRYERSDPMGSSAMQILLAVIRLPHHGSDLVLSLNTPLFISQHRWLLA
jgi:hypothetical protein